MEKLFNYNNQPISYFEKGQGECVVLLHGYLETKEVWQNFSPLLSEQYRVICPDIPGHGKSGTYSEIHSMELIADTLAALLEHLNVPKAHIIGHSMGGYVALAFCKKHNKLTHSLTLFHSSVYADNEEKKENRTREIKLIEQGKLPLIIQSSFPNMFATENLALYTKTINTLQQNAQNHDPQGVCAILRGMMTRADQQEFIQEFTKPLLFIFGKKDNFISESVAQNMLNIVPKANVLWLSNSGHNGFIEEPQKSAAKLIDFLSQQN